MSITDPVGALLKSALDGFSIRQDVIANNIANVDTPGFRARSVLFDAELRTQSADGTAGAGLRPTVVPTDTPVGANGNNVDLRKEVMASVQTQFQYQLASRAVSDRFALIRTMATGQ